MKTAQRIFILYIILMLQLSDQVTKCNVLFRFNFDFGTDLSKTSLNTSLQIGEKPRNITERMSDTYTTTAPLLEDIWAQQDKLNASANDKLHMSRVAVANLNKELTSYVDRSDFIAAKVKSTTRYSHRVDKAFEDDKHEAMNRFLLLQQFVHLVDDLRLPPTEEQGGEHSLDYAVVRMALEKHKLIELQTQILVEILQVMETWQTFTKTQLLDVSTV